MFAVRHNVALAAVVAFLLLGASAAQAAPITYDFTVTGTSGPLNGTAAHGTFSYDSSSIVPRGANQATGLLTSLSFSWNGISYDQTTANTGDLRFDLSGNLTQAQFGSNCSSFGCSLTFGSNSVIAHPTWASGCRGSLAANTNLRTASTDARLAFAVLTTERKAA